VSLYRCTFRVDAELSQALSECLFEAGAEGLQESLSGDALTSYLATPQAVERLVTAFADFRARVRTVLPELEFEEPEIETADDDWQRKWLEALEPQHVTATFVLRPTSRRPAPAGERTIWFEPSASFGAGSHATTRLAASALEQRAQLDPGHRLLDVGAGNGILCLVALSSGAAEAVGVDTLDVAAAACRTNAELNNLAERITAIWGGVEKVSEKFPWVVANIDARTLAAIAPELVQRVQAKGRLWLTGLLDEDAEAVARLYASFGLAETGRTSLEGWTLLEFRRPA